MELALQVLLLLQIESAATLHERLVIQRSQSCSLGDAEKY